MSSVTSRISTPRLLEIWNANFNSTEVMRRSASMIFSITYACMLLWRSTIFDVAFLYSASFLGGSSTSVKQRQQYAREISGVLPRLSTRPRGHSPGERSAAHLSFLVLRPQPLQARTMKGVLEPTPEILTPSSTWARQRGIWRLHVQAGRRNRTRQNFAIVNFRPQNAHKLSVFLPGAVAIRPS
eukprot:9269565-Pyramimonas_sp.AAC.1